MLLELFFRYKLPELPKPWPTRLPQILKWSIYALALLAIIWAWFSETPFWEALFSIPLTFPGELLFFYPSLMVQTLAADKIGEVALQILILLLLPGLLFTTLVLRPPRLHEFSLKSTFSSISSFASEEMWETQVERRRPFPIRLRPSMMTRGDGLKAYFNAQILDFFNRLVLFSILLIWLSFIVMITTSRIESEKINKIDDIIYLIAIVSIVMSFMVFTMGVTIQKSLRQLGLERTFPLPALPRYLCQAFSRIMPHIVLFSGLFLIMVVAAWSIIGELLHHLLWVDNWIYMLIILFSLWSGMAPLGVFWIFIPGYNLDSWEQAIGYIVLFLIIALILLIAHIWWLVSVGFLWAYLYSLILLFLTMVAGYYRFCTADVRV